MNSETLPTTETENAQLEQVATPEPAATNYAQLGERAVVALESIAKSLFVLESAYVQVLRTSGHKIPG